MDGFVGLSRIARKTYLSTCAFLLRRVRRNRQIDLTDMELLVEVGKLSSRVFQEEFPLEQQRGPEHVEEQHAGSEENDGPIRMKENSFCSGP